MKPVLSSGRTVACRGDIQTNDPVLVADDEPAVLECQRRPGFRLGEHRRATEFLVSVRRGFRHAQFPVAAVNDVNQSVCDDQATEIEADFGIPLDLAVERNAPQSAAHVGGVAV